MHGSPICLDTRNAIRMSRYKILRTVRTISNACTTTLQMPCTSDNRPGWCVVHPLPLLYHAMRLLSSSPCLQMQFLSEWEAFAGHHIEPLVHVLLCSISSHPSSSPSSPSSPTTTTEFGRKRTGSRVGACGTDCGAVLRPAAPLSDR